MTLNDLSPVPFEPWLEKFLEEYVPRERAFNEALWKAQTTGRKEDEGDLAAKEIRFRKLLQDPAGYRYLAGLEKQREVREPPARRQLVLLRREFEENQMDEKTLEQAIDLRVRIESEYNNFRSRLGGEEVTDNRIREILRDSGDSGEVKAAWEASKEIGPRVADRILELVEIRNRVALQLGHPNHQVLALKLAELDPEELFKLLDRIDRVTAAPYQTIKQSIDAELSARFHVPAAELAPWHYGDPFFQAPPRRSGADLDPFYEGKDLVELATRFFDGLGLEIRDLLERSDLYERPGKCQHAFCMDMNRQGDVRVLCNLKSKEKWMGTMLHEFGHAVYDKYFDPALPHLLRGPAHIFCTEAIAMLFGRLSQNRRFLSELAGASGGGSEAISRAAREELRRGQIIFMRWALVMVHFERELYGNPGQDLNRRWWDLVERFQGLKPPPGRNAPDWATKIHIATSPVYYQNYMLGELAASQLENYLIKEVLGEKNGDGGSMIGRREAGRFLVEHIFRPGRRWPWSELIRKATGKPLDAEHFIEQFARRE
ncbi:MAG: M2 family metallopeptidase [Planctomycetes bacterium]|nr:M2 family metallopeptidase [Planctomycetota bacterium]